MKRVRSPRGGDRRLHASQRPGAAHPLGNFTVNTYSGLVVRPPSVEIRFVLDRRPGDSFIDSEPARSGLAERAHLVDMEGSAVAYAASREGASVRLVKHVSDSSGDDARRDWREAVDAQRAGSANWVRANV